MTGTIWPMRVDRPADLAALDDELREALRAVAATDPVDAEERLTSLLRWSRSDVTHRYVVEVLVGGAKHDDWIARNHARPTPEQQLSEMLGRTFSTEETARVPTIADLSDIHRTVASEVLRTVGRMAAKDYLRLVLHEHRTEVLTDYVESVLEGRRSHTQWVARNLPRLGPAR